MESLMESFLERYVYSYGVLVYVKTTISLQWVCDGLNLARQSACFLSEKGMG